LGTALNNSTTPSTIDVVYNAANYATMQRIPGSGRLYIDTEEFSYTSKTVTGTTLTFNGISRELRRSSIAIHNVGATIKWIPYDISVLYDNSAATAMVMDDTRKPIINLATSTNSSFVYAYFLGTGSNGSLRAGSWRIAEISYTANNLEAPVFPYYCDEYDLTLPDPAEVMGTRVNTVMNRNGIKSSGWGYIKWEYASGDQITEVSSNGKKYVYDNVNSYTFNLAFHANDPNPRGGGVLKWLESTITTADTWEAWTHNNVAIQAGIYSVRFQALMDVPLGGVGRDLDNNVMCEVSDATLAFSTKPTITTRTYIETLKIDAVVTNSTTSQYINISFPLQTQKTLVIETDPNNPSAKVDGQIVSGISPNTHRTNWLPLRPGDNTLTFTANSTGNITCTVKWRDRINFL
jgi:hypothetical protein